MWLVVCGGPEVDGRCSWSCLPISNCAGLEPQASGVFRIASSPVWMSCFALMHFFILLLTVLTDDSASPLDLG